MKRHQTSKKRGDAIKRIDMRYAATSIQNPVRHRFNFTGERFKQKIRVPRFDHFSPPSERALQLGG